MRRSRPRAASVERLRGKPGDLQLTLKMIEALQAKAAEEAVQRAEAEQKKRAAKRAEHARKQTGPTPQPMIPVVEREFTLDETDRACPSCGGGLRPMTGQLEESELME